MADKEKILFYLVYLQGDPRPMRIKDVKAGKALADVLVGKDIPTFIRINGTVVRTYRIEKVEPITHSTWPDNL